MITEDREKMKYSTRSKRQKDNPATKNYAPIFALPHEKREKLAKGISIHR